LGWKPRRSSNADPRYSNMRRLTAGVTGAGVDGVPPSERKKAEA